MFCQSAASDQANSARGIPDTDTAKGGFVGFFWKVMQQKNLCSYTVCLVGKSVTISILAGALSHWRLLVILNYIYILCVCRVQLWVSQKQGCKVQIKQLTKEVANYQLIGIAFKLTVIPWNPLWICSCFGENTLRWPEIKQIWTGLQVIYVVRMSGLT